ncbi:MAG: hypothetical protein J5644_05580 [Bacteroidales bacterium]|nr:hypothetical protein [Bacteroidales bacterium]
MENSKINNSELETMRAQIALLKEKLDKETIVSEKLLRDTMRHKARSINTNAWISVAASIFVIIWAMVYIPKEGFSWWFAGATVLMMLVCDFFTWKYHKDVNAKTMSGDLLTVAKVMKRLRDNYKKWLKYSIAMISVWFVWLSIEFCIQLKDWRLAIVMIITLLIGLAIGGFIGLKMHNSVIRNAEEIISQIEEGEEKEG